MDTESKKILIADDESDILEIIGFNLTKEGFTIYTAKDGNEAILKAQQLQPHLIILDVMMPYKNGIEVCSILRQHPSLNEVPIILLTAINDEQTHIKGLESGADDYVNKPISPKVLVSRVKSLLRRTNITSINNIIEIGDFIIDSDKFSVSHNGEIIILAKKEFELFRLLASKPGRVFLRDEILNMVWGSEIIVGDRTIDVHVRKIRQKIKVDCIATVKGVGYKFEVS
ncbi:MAG: response regulator transcription factor [Chitinophagaceae bacterium]|nr:response regulator transcription factor [Chitinophagaceae bacterium]